MMHIAVSGTHSIGKTTFINDFVKKYPTYRQEIEPYHQLQDHNLFELSLEPTLDSLIEQLEYSIMQFHSINENEVIFDRCPIDFIAYAMYITDQEMININGTVIAEKFHDVKAVLENLDLIVFLPITEKNDMEYTEEDSEYRETVDYFFKQLYREDIFDVFPRYDHPKIIEVSGDRESRIQQIEAYL